MKLKHGISIFLSILGFQMAHAQNAAFGIEAGLNISTLRFSPPASAYSTSVTVGDKVGGKIGCFLIVPIAGNFSFQPGLYYSTKGGKLTGQLHGDAFDLKYSYQYLEIPITLKYRYKNVVFGAGPYIGIAVGSHVKVRTTDTSFKQKIFIGNNEDTDGIKRMDAGINLSFGYILASGVFLSAQYELGLANVEPGANTTEKHSTVSFSVGYLFNSRKKHDKSKNTAVPK